MLGSKRTPLIGHTSSVQRNLDNSVGTATKTFGQVMKSLFANNEQGFALDFYDTNMLFQDAAGTTPVTAAGQPVGLVFDKSKGLTLGVELLPPVANKSLWGVVGSPTYGNVTVDGTSVILSSNTGGVLAYTTGPFSSSKMYKFSITVAEITGGALFLENAEAGGAIRIDNPGTYTCVARNVSKFYFRNGGPGSAITARITAASAKEIVGNHAYQATSSMRPILRDNPRRADYDGVDDKLLVNLPSTLTNCTVVRATAFAGVEVDTDVTITSPVTLNTDACAMLVINRALTAKELSDVKIAFEQLLRASRVKYLIQSMFANGEVGFAYDMEDITPEKTAWRRNLLTYSNDYSNVIWTKQNTTVTPSIAAPDGSYTASKLIANATLNTHQLYTTFAAKSWKIPVTISFYAKAAELSKIIVFANWDITGQYDLSTGIATGNGRSMVPVGNGWYRCSYTGNADDTVTRTYGIRLLDASGEFNFTGDGVKGVYIWGAQLEYGSLTDYQPITDFKTEFLKAFPQHVLYQDVAGTIPALLPSDPVSLFLDKSKGLVLGSELVINGDFSDGLTGWTPVITTPATVNVVNSTAELSAVGVGAISRLRKLLTVSAGTWYKVQVDVTGNTSSSTVLQLGSTAGGTDYGNFALVSGKNTFHVYVAGTNLHVQIYKGANNGTIYVDNVSIKSISGNHAYQPTSSCRPLLGRHPVGGARNLLTYSGTVTDTSWQFAGGTKTGGQLDSDGGYTATKITGPSTGPTLKINTTAPITGAYTYTVCLKAGTQTTAELLLRNSTTSTNFTIGTINLTTGVITGAGWTSKAKPNGFWECSFTQATGISKDDALYCYYGTLGSATASFDIIVDYAQLEVGSVATTYQETTTLLDITERGKADAWYLKYDGVDDFLYTNAIDFTGTDKVSLFSGVLKLSDASQSMIAEFSQGNVAGSFMLHCGGGSGSEAYTFGSRGNATMYSYAILGKSNYPLLAGSRSNVLSVFGEISTDLSKIKVDPSYTSSNPTIDQGTGNYGNYPLYIGRRGGTSLPFNGHIYSLVGVGRLTTDFETSQLEQALSKTVGVNI